MSSISGVSGSGDAWASMKAQRSQMQVKMFAKVDTNSSGSVDKTELDKLLSDVASKTGVTNSSSSEELFAKMDTNSDGSLSSDELGKGLKSIMPPPPTTMEFAQSRSDSNSSASSNNAASDDLFGKVDTDGNGSLSETEMTTLMDKMGMNFSSDSFAKIDSNSDGSLSTTEFESARHQGAAAPQGSGGPQAAGGMPPPPPPGGSGGGGGAASSSTTYDPLDTNQDGTVSLAERLAGSTSSASTNAVDTLLKTMDTNNDQQISEAETGAFMDKLSAQLESGTSTDGIDLAELVTKAYEQIANAATQPSTGTTLSAMA